jgi:hypothetical protein
MLFEAACIEGGMMLISARSRLTLLATLLSVVIFAEGCRAIVGIFKVGFWAGIILAAIVVAIVIAFIRAFSRS